MFSPQGTRIGVGDIGKNIISVYNIVTGQTSTQFEGQSPLAEMLKFLFDDSWEEEVFYTIDRSGQWVLHGKEGILAIPPNLQYGNGKLDLY